MSITIPVEAVRARLDNGRLWLQGEWGTPADPTAGTCLQGAIRACQPTPGDACLVEEVGARFGFGTAANDKAADWSEVERMLVEHAEVTDAMLADTFGPQWVAVVALVRRAAVLTAGEAEKLAARAAAWAAARDAARDAARAAAWDAALALGVRDLIGHHGFTQSHYDLLTRPWATVNRPDLPEQSDRTPSTVPSLGPAQTTKTCGTTACRHPLSDPGHTRRSPTTAHTSAATVSGEQRGHRTHETRPSACSRSPTYAQSPRPSPQTTG